MTIVQLIEKCKTKQTELLDQAKLASMRAVLSSDPKEKQIMELLTRQLERESAMWLKFGNELVYLDVEMDRCIRTKQTS